MEKMMKMLAKTKNKWEKKGFKNNKLMHFNRKKEQKNCCLLEGNGRNCG
jgi:hypothetical protein